MPLVADLVSSTLARGSSGWVKSVDYLVTGAFSLKQAIDAVGIPHGAEDTEIGGIFALDFNARREQDDPQATLVTVGYRIFTPSPLDDDPPPPVASGGLIEVSTRVQEQPRSKDINGNQIVAQHTHSTTDGTGNIQVGVVTQPAEVGVFVPTTVLRVSRRENDSPLVNSQTYVGRLNSGSFAGEAEGLWLCTGIDGSSEDQGASYDVVYEFELRREGWDVTVVFIDERTGRPVIGITEGIELQTYRVYETANFSALDLGV